MRAEESQGQGNQRIGKQKVKCVKASSKELTISFGEDILMGEVANKARMVLVGHV